MNENKKNTKINIYTDLDSIFDTRLPILFEMDEDLVEKMVKNKTYHYRVNDNFEYIPQNMFKILYRNRSKMVLTKGTPTGILPLINKYNVEARLAAVTANSNPNTILYLNTYPYPLMSSELDALIVGLRSSIPNIAIKPIFEKPSDITPEWINENVALMIMYDGLEWIERHVSNHNLMKTPLTDIVMMVPSLLYNNIKYHAKDKQEILKMFETLEETYRTLIKVRFLDTELFSTLL